MNGFISRCRLARPAAAAAAARRLTGCYGDATATWSIRAGRSGTTTRPGRRSSAPFAAAGRTTATSSTRRSGTSTSSRAPTSCNAGGHGQAGLPRPPPAAARTRGVYLQTARDVAVRPGRRRTSSPARGSELDTKRVAAVQRYLTAQPAGRPSTSRCSCTTRPMPGIPARRPAARSAASAGGYRGGLTAAAGGGSAGGRRRPRRPPAPAAVGRRRPAARRRHRPARHATDSTRTADRADRESGCAAHPAALPDSGQCTLRRAPDDATTRATLPSPPSLLGRACCAVLPGRRPPPRPARRARLGSYWHEFVEHWRGRVSSRTASS